jgi:hypothetical protein
LGSGRVVFTGDGGIGSLITGVGNGGIGTGSCGSGGST